MGDTWCKGVGRDVLSKFRRWEREAKKENSDTLANILDKEES